MARDKAGVVEAVYEELSLLRHSLSNLQNKVQN